MFHVYVRHFLTEQGIDFVKNEWYQKVHDLMNSLPGFVSFSYEANQNEDWMTFIVSFTDQISFNQWNVQHDHDLVIDELDPYRSRDYWEYANSNCNKTEGLLDWQVVKIF